MFLYNSDTIVVLVCILIALVCQYTIPTSMCYTSASYTNASANLSAITILNVMLDSIFSKYESFKFNLGTNISVMLLQICSSPTRNDVSSL